MPVLRVSDPAVKAAFDAYPHVLHQPLAELREMILETAAALSGVGPLEEGLAWGQPAYWPQRPNVGTTIRIGPVRDDPESYGLFVHCQTTLVDTFRRLYPGRLRFSGTRALVFSAGEIPPVAPVRHFIALALTYHRRDPSTSAAKRSSRMGRTRAVVSA